MFLCFVPYEAAKPHRAVQGLGDVYLFLYFLYLVGFIVSIPQSYATRAESIRMKKPQKAACLLSSAPARNMGAIKMPIIAIASLIFCIIV